MITFQKLTTGQVIADDGVNKQIIQPTAQPVYDLIDSTITISTPEKKYRFDYSQVTLKDTAGSTISTSDMDDVWTQFETVFFFE